jgi:hypothetical protein
MTIQAGGINPFTHMTGRNVWLRSVLPIAVVYVVVGIVTADLARSAQTIHLRNLSRLAAWALSLIVFLGHVGHERLRVLNTAKQAALHAAAAVALGALILAAVGPVRSHWNATDFWRTALLSLALWPILTSVPAFLAALVAGSILGRLFVREKSAPSQSSI